MSSNPWPRPLASGAALAPAIARGFAATAAPDRAWVRRATASSGADAAGDVYYANVVTGETQWAVPASVVDLAAAARAAVAALAGGGDVADVAAALGLNPPSSEFVAVRNLLCSSAPGGCIDVTDVHVALSALSALLPAARQDDAAALVEAAYFDLPFFVGSLLGLRTPPPTAALALALCRRFVSLTPAVAPMLVTAQISTLPALLESALRLAACAALGPAGCNVNACGASIGGSAALAAPLPALDDAMFVDACAGVALACHAAQGVLLTSAAAAADDSNGDSDIVSGGEERAGIRGAWRDALASFGVDAPGGVESPTADGSSVVLLLQRSACWLLGLAQLRDVSGNSRVCVALAGALAALHQAACLIARGLTGGAATAADCASCAYATAEGDGDAAPPVSCGVCPSRRDGAGSDRNGHVVASAAVDAAVGDESAGGVVSEVLTATGLASTSPRPLEMTVKSTTWGGAGAGRARAALSTGLVSLIVESRALSRRRRAGDDGGPTLECDAPPPPESVAEALACGSANHAAAAALSLTAASLEATRSADPAGRLLLATDAAVSARSLVQPGSVHRVAVPWLARQ